MSDQLEDPKFIKERIAAVTPKRCEAELRGMYNIAEPEKALLD